MRKISSISLVLALLVMMTSCGKTCMNTGHERYRHVFIYYMSGYNNLSSYLIKNLEDLESGVLPDKARDQALLVFSHTTRSDYDYTTPNPPCLIQLHRDKGKCVADTLIVYPESSVSSSASTMRSVLEDVNRLFPSDSYGMLFSSHATGWLPEGYLNSGARATAIPEETSLYPLTKSIGAQYDGNARNSYEMELDDFAAAIPMKLDYIIFDACLMGGVEVAWELRSVCDRIVVSPAEVIARGFIYKPMSWRIFSGAEPDIEGICKDYFSYYDTQSGNMRAATVTLVDCRSLDELAASVRYIIARHRDAVPQARKDCQGYFYDSKKYYFDLRDFARSIGASETELGTLDNALEECIPYHAETPDFFDVPLERCCGLSTYIPSDDYPNLNTFYKTLSWNEEVGLVE